MIWRMTLPSTLFRIFTASWWLNPSSECPLTDKIWSPRFSPPCSAAAPVSNTVLTYIGMSPWGLPKPPTIENPRPCSPLFSSKVWGVPLTAPWGGKLLSAWLDDDCCLRFPTFNRRTTMTILPCAILRTGAASSCELLVRSEPLTNRIWSPWTSRPSESAAPPLTT